MRPLPPFRYFLYVLGTVNAVMSVVLVLSALAFSNGVNIVPVAIVVLAGNIVSAVTVARQFRGAP
jgi:CHASE2 domain-containing sensor protein